MYDRVPHSNMEIGIDVMGDQPSANPSSHYYADPSIAEVEYSDRPPTAIDNLKSWHHQMSQMIEIDTPLRFALISASAILELADNLDSLNPVWEALTAYITSSAELCKKYNERLTELEDKIKACAACAAGCVPNDDTIAAFNEDTASLPRFHSVDELSEYLNADEEPSEPKPAPLE